MASNVQGKDKRKLTTGQKILSGVALTSGLGLGAWGVYDLIKSRRPPKTVTNAVKSVVETVVSPPALKASTVTRTVAAPSSKPFGLLMDSSTANRARRSRSMKSFQRTMARTQTDGYREAAQAYYTNKKSRKALQNFEAAKKRALPPWMSPNMTAGQRRRNLKVWRGFGNSVFLGDLAEFGRNQAIQDLSRRSTKALLQLVNSRTLSGTSRSAALKIINARQGLTNSNATSTQVKRAFDFFGKGKRVGSMDQLTRAASKTGDLRRASRYYPGNLPPAFQNRYREFLEGRAGLNLSDRQQSILRRSMTNDMRLEGDYGVRLRSLQEANNRPAANELNRRDYSDIRAVNDPAVSSTGYVGYATPSARNSKYGGMMEEEVPYIQDSDKLSRRYKSGESMSQTSRKRTTLNPKYYL